MTPSPPPSAGWLARFLDAEQLPAAFGATAGGHYEPLADWLAGRAARRPGFLFGINGAQGSGKSTLARYLKDALRARGLRAALVSLDDFYLGRGQRAQLAADVHPLLAVRGVPGTHDTGLLGRCLDELARLDAGERCAWPRFDKGSDDRAATRRQQAGPVDLVLLEGWCVGTPAEADAALTDPINALERDRDPDGRWRHYVNDCLRRDYAALFARLDALCFLQVPDFDAVCRWRIEQERKLRDGGGQTCMSDADIAQFVQYFERLTRVALRELPARADVVLVLDERHACVASRYAGGAQPA